MKKHFYDKIQEEYKEPETKDNHLIPQFLLRNFSKKNTSESVYINLLTKEKEHPKLRKNKVYFKNMFSKNLFFNDNLEKYFGLIETKSAPLISTINKHSQKEIKHHQYSHMIHNLNIYSNVFSLDIFKFTDEQLGIIANLYSSIIVRIFMANSQDIIDEKYITSYCDEFYYQLTENFEVDNIELLKKNLLSFKNTILSVDENKLVMDLNEDYYENSQAKLVIIDFIKHCLLNKKALLITWDAPIIKIANYIPFSWQNKVMLLPLSCNSLLYLDFNENFDSSQDKCLNYIKNNTKKLLIQYHDNISKYGTEFLYYDKTIFEKKSDSNNFKYRSNN